MAELRTAIPLHLLRKSTTKGLAYVFQDVLCAYFLYCLTPYIPLAPALLRLPLWVAYWWCQGIVLTGWWCLGHEAGHKTISQYSWVNHVVGYILHTAILTPYFAWRVTHRNHHKATMSVERDENYVPRTRSEYGLWDEKEDERLGLLRDEEGLPGCRKGLDPHDVFSDAPLYVLLRMLIMQATGWPLYLLTDATGNPRYPLGTNHFSPSSALFKPRHRRQIIASNAGLCVALALFLWWASQTSLAHVGRVYGVPYILANHWIIMITYIQHTDPTMPHYRSQSWSFVRGALGTVDRPVLGWVGRIFLHHVSHDHVAHHLFPSIPFYNQPEVTKIIRPLLGDAYNCDSTNSFRALYRTSTQCCFIEDEGDIVFYKNRDGKAARFLADEVVQPSKIVI